MKCGTAVINLQLLMEIRNGKASLHFEGGMYGWIAEGRMGMAGSFAF